MTHGMRIETQNDAFNNNNKNTSVVIQHSRIFGHYLNNAKNTNNTGNSIIGMCLIVLLLEECEAILFIRNRHGHISSAKQIIDRYLPTQPHNNTKTMCRIQKKYFLKNKQT